VSYKQVRNLEPTEFKRLCGVTPATFEQMVKVVAAEKVLAKKRMRARRVSRRFSAPSRAADPKSPPLRRQTLRERRGD
jgi:hypothetical protein